jgi:hypothetical protein
MAWARDKEPYESVRQRHERIQQQEPSRTRELHRKLSSEILNYIIQHMFWYGSSAEETAESVFKYFDGVTKEEIDTASELLAHVAESAIFRELRKRTRRSKKTANRQANGTS